MVANIPRILPLAELLLVVGLVLGVPLTAHFLDVASHFTVAEYRGFSIEDIQRLVRLNVRLACPVPYDLEASEFKVYERVKVLIVDQTGQ